jgi:hypothetical protein
MAINCAESNNWNAARKVSAAEANIQRWKEQKQKLTNTNMTQKYFSGFKHGLFQESEKEIGEFVELKWKTGVLITCETIKYYTWELVKLHNITQHHIKASTHTYVHVMWRNRLTLYKRFTLPYNASRLWAEACCFWVTCNWTSKQEQLPPERNRKCWWNTSIFWYVIQLRCSWRWGRCDD